MCYVEDWLIEDRPEMARGWDAKTGSYSCAVPKEKSMRGSSKAAAFVLPALLAGSASAVYQIGDIVDDFVRDDVHGVSHSLYDYEGKLIVLNFGEYW